MFYLASDTDALLRQREEDYEAACHLADSTSKAWQACKRQLAARERAVWLEAANKPGQHHIDDIGQCDAVSWMKGYLACKHDYKVWCRQQAEGVKP